MFNKIGIHSLRSKKRIVTNNIVETCVRNNKELKKELYALEVDIYCSRTGLNPIYKEFKVLSQGSWFEIYFYDKLLHQTSDLICFLHFLNSGKIKELIKSPYLASLIEKNSTKEVSSDSFESALNGRSIKSQNIMIMLFFNWEVLEKIVDTLDTQFYMRVSKYEDKVREVSDNFSHFVSNLDFNPLLLSDYYYLQGSIFKGNKKLIRESEIVEFLNIFKGITPRSRNKVDIIDYTDVL